MTVLLHVSPVWCSDQLLYVYIDAVSGEDSTECLNSNSPVKACQSLSFVADNLTRTNLVEIEIVSERLNLNKPIQFKGYTHLTLNGTGKTLHCNESNAGLAFVSVRKLSIGSITIDQCGALRESTSVDPQKPNETERLSVAVYLLNCTDVTIWRVDIQSSNGTGLSLYDTNGLVTIEFSNFTNNSAVQSEVGGGGLRIEFTLCSPGIAGVCLDHHRQNHNSMYAIRNCNFFDNTVTCPSVRHTVVAPSVNKPVLRVGKGGGVYISIGHDACCNNFTISNCDFRNNSASFNAGGMLVEFLNSVHENTVSVYNTNFTENNCIDSYVGSGGGLTVVFMFYIQIQLPNMQPAKNSFSCSNCTLIRNNAYIGGGMSIFVTKEVNNATHNSIVFSHCKWTENSSPLGAAVYVSPGLWDYTVQGFTPVPLFFDCTFHLNSAFQQIPSLGSGLKVMSLGYGAVFISELHVLFEGRSYFSDNKGSAVYLSNSVLEFREGSVVTFYNNIAHNGGAITMHGSSIININNGSTFNFTKNTAYSTGGAIYTDVTADIQSTYRNCFIQSTSRDNFKTNSTFIFEGNYAKQNGHSIFATTFRPCKIMCSAMGEDVPINQPDELLQCVAHFCFNDSVKNSLSIATPPKNFTLDETSPVMIKPGTDHTLLLTATDETNKRLAGVIYEAIIFWGNATAKPQVSNNTINIWGNVHDSAVLRLDTSDVSLSFNITFVDCKPGYIHITNTCECAASMYLGLVTCDPKVLLKHGYWMGYCSSNSTTLCTTFCPYGFCSYHDMEPEARVHPLPDDSSLLDFKICGPYRTGRLCSKCVNGSSVYFHSWRYTCGSEHLCHVGWVFYLISEILPLTLFFIIILVFNVSFTNGNLNGFVLFAQILDALASNGNGAIEFPYFITVIRSMLTFFYRPFNLDFFSLEQLSFCMWKGAEVLDVLLMKYATVGFSLVLVLLTILIARYRCARFKIFAKFHTPNSVLIHGLSAFFVLCYSQSTRVTFQILNFFCLYSTNFQCEEKAVNRIGYMNYLEGDHIKYAIVAIFVLIFLVIIPPLLLLLYPLVFKLLGLCKLSESKLAGILWRVMPIQLLDSFQSSFKDNFRFFAGLYFLYRAIAVGAYAYSQKLTVFYIVVQIQLTIILSVHAIFQPYKKVGHNVIDALLFTNLAIINGITLYNYSEKVGGGLDFSSTAIQTTSVIQVVLISLPFLFIIILCVRKLMIEYKKWQSNNDNSSDSIERMDNLPPLRDFDDGSEEPPYHKLVS